jgi:hypothetical protein
MLSQVRGTACVLEACFFPSKYVGVRLNKAKRAAIEAVTRKFSASLEEGAGPPDALLRVAGKPVATEIAIVSVPAKGAKPNPTRPRLRFDKVVVSLMSRLRTSLRDSVPAGETVVVTVTAPIRLASKTADALEEKARVLLARRSARRVLEDTVHGNQIRIQVMKGGPAGAAKFIGFVHNPDSDPTPLFEVAQALLGCIGKVPGRKPPRFSGDHWLVLADRSGSAHPDVYRHVYPELAVPTDFKKILLVLPDGRITTLTASASL